MFNSLQRARNSKTLDLHTGHNKISQKENDTAPVRIKRKYCTFRHKFNQTQLFRFATRHQKQKHKETTTHRYLFSRSLNAQRYFVCRLRYLQTASFFNYF